MNTMGTSGTLLWICVIGVIISSDSASSFSSFKNGMYMVNRWYRMSEVSGTPFETCGGSATINSVQVIPCDDESECDLKTGSNATFNIGFTAKSNAVKLKAVVHGVVAGIPMPFHFPQEDACQKSNISCPIKPAQIYNYSVQLPVLRTYPKIKVTVKWQLKDESGSDVICVEIPARLV